MDADLLLSLVPARPVASPLLSARWRLVYTTSDSILGKTRPAPFRPAGNIMQVGTHVLHSEGG